MELKVICNCGQKYKFDVEPAEGRMPHPVNCPACGMDGTPSANATLATLAQPATTTTAMETTPPAGLRINRQTPASPPPPPLNLAATPNIPPTLKGNSAVAATPKYLRTNQATASNNFMLGILGAVIGAIVAIACMVGFYLATGLKFPLTGTLMGAVIGYGARLMYKGTSSSLGGVSAAVALVTIPSTLFLLFGPAALVLGLLSILVGTGMAFRIASN